MKRLLATASAAALLLAMPALAQNQDMSPGTPPPAANPTTTAPDAAATQELNATDRTFIDKAAMGGMAEVEFGKMAQEKARSDAVKDFARHMVEDHSKANDQLMALTQQLNVTPPAELDAKHQRARQKLENVSGRQFDGLYIHDQLKGHQETAELFEHEMNEGQNADLKRFASDTLPTIQQHLQMVQGIAEQIRPQTSELPPDAKRTAWLNRMNEKERPVTQELNRQELQRIQQETPSGTTQ